MSNLIAIILGALLLITNPTKAEFEDFVGTRVAAEMPKRLQSSDRFTNQLVGTFVSKLATEATEHANYYLFSVYTVDLSPLKIFKPELPATVKILAIAGQFIPLTQNQLIK